MFYKRATLITSLSAAFLVGLVLGRQHWQADLFLIGTITLAVLISAKSKLLLPAVILLGLALGIYRGYGYIDEFANLQGYIGQKVTVTGKVSDDPSTSDKNHLNFALTGLEVDGQKLDGEIRARTYYAKVQRGYLVEVTGKLEETLGAKQAQIGFGSISVLDDTQSPLEHWRQRFFAGMRTALPEPLSGFALGLLVGARALIPKSLQDQLTAVGLSHLVAVSGYNLTIIVNATHGLFGRYSKFLGTAAAMWLIAGFVLLTGGSASIVRAALVSILLLLARYWGREFQPIALISLAAAVTAATKPIYLYSDLGWQLSFLAFFGVLVAAPLVTARFKRPNRIKSMLVETLSAQVMTFPLIALIFGRASVISPLANLIVLPLVPLVMLLSFVAGLGGMWLPLLSGWLALPAQLLLTVMIVWVQKLAAWPYASQTLQFDTKSLVAIYAMVAALVMVMYQSAARLRYNQQETELEIRD